MGRLRDWARATRLVSAHVKAIESRGGEPEEYPWVTCIECGERDQATYSDPTKSAMVQRSLCFYCLYWTRMVEERGDSSHFVANGHHYTIGPEGVYGKMAGNGGRKWVIYLNEGGKVHTHNLWHQGEIPERFRDRLPDTAVLMEDPRS